MHTLNKEVFTKRMVLSIISSFYHHLTASKTELKGALVLGRTVNNSILAMPEKQGNISDLATRGKASIKDVSMGSTWQTGPEYLTESRETWPVSCNFLRLVQKEEIRSWP